MKTLSIINKLKREYRKSWFFYLPTLEKGWFLTKLAFTLYFMYIGVRLLELVIITR